MVKRYDVEGVRSPGGRYSHVGEINPGARIYHLAGQTGHRPDGSTPESFEEQTEQVYANIEMILKQCGMTFENLARVTVYLLDHYLPFRFVTLAYSMRFVP